MIGKVISHYKVLEKLGEGGMGEVYKARDLHLDRFVVLKFLRSHLTTDKEVVERFQREAKAAAALNHSNIVTIHEISEFEGQIFIVMEYIEGISLREKISKDLSIKEIINITIQICEGLKRAHQADIVHRDIKPENILIDKENQVKIVDFGLAKLKGLSKQTKENTILGTICYMSPEQLIGEEIDSRTDIWSLGIVIYEMLTKQLPFKGEYEQAISYSILNEEPISLYDVNKDITNGFQNLITQCLQKKTENRLKSISAVCAQLQHITEHDELFDITAKKRKSFLHKITTPFLVKLNITLVIIVLLSLFIFDFHSIKTRVFQAGIPRKKQIAVLPFSNLTGDENNQHYCDGLFEILTSKLCQFEQFQSSLSIVPSTEIRQFNIMSAFEAKKQFGVNLVIKCNLQKNFENTQLIFNLDLIDAKTLRMLKSKPIIIPLKETSNINFMEEIVNILASMLRVELNQQNRDLLAAGNTPVPVAFNYYLQGRGYLQNYYSLENIENAIQLFKQALAEDSEFALAYAGLGDAFWKKYEHTKDSQWITPAIDHCNKALEINDLLAEAHNTLGVIYQGSGKFAQAIDEFKKIIAIDSVNSGAFHELAKTYAAKGDSINAEVTYLKAIKMKPDYWANYYFLGNFYYYKGDYEKAEKQYLLVLQYAPFNFKAYRNLGAVYMLMDRYEDAQRMLEYSLEIQHNYGTYANLGIIHFSKQEYKKAAEMYEKALELNDKNYVNWGNLAICYLEILENQFRKSPCLE